MNRLIKSTLLAAVSASLIWGSANVMAQAQGAGGGQAAPGGNRQRGQGGNFDPAQMQQRMMERYKERLDITSDDDWNPFRR